MLYRFNALCAIWVVALLLVSCSSHGAEPIAANPSPDGAIAHSGVGSELIWGIWDVSVDPATREATIVPLRKAEFTCNVTRFLQPPIASKSLLSIAFDPTSDFSKGYVVADVTLTHPFPGMDLYTGFDVRGVVIGNGSVAGVDDPAVLYAGENDLQLLNADGLTRWFNPSEFTTYGKLFGFTMGNKGDPSYDFTAILNGYRYFCDKLDKSESAAQFFADSLCPNPRGYFPAGGTVTRRYEMRFPVVSGKPKFHFQYAVVASWEPPIVNPPGNVPDDFPISASCAEAYAMSSADVSNMYYVSDSEKGGSIQLMVRVFDHQGAVGTSGVAGEIKAIDLETPNGMIPGNKASFAGDELSKSLKFQDSVSATYFIQVYNPVLTASGVFPILVCVKSNNPGTYNSGIPGFTFPADAELAAYMSAEVRVKPAEQGWVATWGGDGEDSYAAVALGPDGSIYVTGWFLGTVDFDPGPGVVNLTSNGSDDVFLSKFAPSGDLVWARTWGGDFWDSGHGVTVDQAGNAYVVGVFLGTVDFDPGSGVDSRVSNGYADVFLSKFDIDGNYQWVRTWGGASADCDYGEAISEDGAGNIYVSGKFSDTVDFDPGPGVDNHGTNGGWDVFLSKFKSDGSFEWARTWGGAEWDGGWGVIAAKTGNIYITGWFKETVDLDPGFGSCIVTSNGGTDAFLSDFDPSGILKWARTWGGTGDDQGYEIAIDLYSDVYVVGDFNNIVDFDPGTGVDSRTSNGLDDISLSKFDSSGIYKGTLTWGGPASERSGGVGVDDSGNVYATGSYQAAVDFDPGPGVENRTSNGNDDIFISKFNPSGQFQWVRTLGGPDSDYGGFLVADKWGNMFVNGSFNDAIDFDPGPGEEIHTTNGSSDVYLLKLLPTGFW